LRKKKSLIDDRGRDDHQKVEKAFLVGCYGEARDRSLCLEHLIELEALANTYGLEVVQAEASVLRRISASLYLGRGKGMELAEKVEEVGADLLIFDEEITPQQQRNLEKLFQRPVIDRTELILEIFSKRALTKEARLQVELAKNAYQLPRLRRMWTHLSRQSTGGKGFLKGEGERQIAIDRHLIRKRIGQLKSEIEEVRRHRQVQRRARQRSRVPTFGIVGYTNVGKSTLLRALTEADVLVEDQLFATLDTTVKRYILPNHQKILLVDTVGFIRKLPHTLVEAFKSTLEEVAYTDCLLHLVDISHPLAEEHAESTYRVLEELHSQNKPMVTVLNKVDLVDDRSVIPRFKFKYPRGVVLSAKSGEGFDLLTEAIMQVIRDLREVVCLRIPQKEYKMVGLILKEGELLKQRYEDNDLLLQVEIPKALRETVRPFIV